MAKIDDSVKKKVPELRFKGFTDDWEQRKLSNESTITAGGDIDKSKLKEVGEYPIFANALTNDGTVGYYDSYYRVEAPAVTVTGRGDVGHAKARKVNFTPVVRLLAVKSNHDVDFLENAINNHKVLVESTGVPQLTAPQLGNYKIFFPTGEEQQKIGSFFKQLDDTIALHQRKLDLLKEQKKGFLQKMFPKNGAKVPELRFAGFADDWEERKLSDIADRFDNLRVPITVSDRKPGDTPYYGANGIQDYVEGFTHNGEFILVAEDGANDLKNYPVQYVNGKVWVNNHAHVLQGKKTITDNKFLMNAIKNFNIEPFLVGGGRAKLNADVMMKLNILLPTFVEQEKIGSLFSLLDKTIALHQRKLDLLKEQKKGFLQKMFV